VNHVRDYTLIVVCIWMCSTVKDTNRGGVVIQTRSLVKLKFLRKGSLLEPERFRKESCSVRNEDQETMGVVEQDNDKEKEQLDSFEGPHVQGTREL
jgi:hypothetical protein